ncbi:MAG: DUF4169 family protein [Methylocystis sp.]|nr:DUF4169 family protein [Methylocystis sp.]MBI3274451.1 DUF4169 family protein [Methylocystis sp.]
MGEIVNLRRARKRQDKRRQEAAAHAKRRRCGRAKAEREHSDASAALERAKLEAHRLTPEEASARGDDA